MAARRQAGGVGGVGALAVLAAFGLAVLAAWRCGDVGGGGAAAWRWHGRRTTRWRWRGMEIRQKARQVRSGSGRPANASARVGDARRAAPAGSLALVSVVAHGRRRNGGWQGRCGANRDAFGGYGSGNGARADSSRGASSRSSMSSQGDRPWRWWGRWRRWSAAVADAGAVAAVVAAGGRGGGGGGGGRGGGGRGGGRR